MDAQKKQKLDSRNFLVKYYKNTNFKTHLTAASTNYIKSAKYQLPT